MQIFQIWCEDPLIDCSVPSGQGVNRVRRASTQVGQRHQNLQFRSLSGEFRVAIVEDDVQMSYNVCIFLYIYESCYFS